MNPISNFMDMTKARYVLILKTIYLQDHNRLVDSMGNVLQFSHESIRDAVTEYFNMTTNGDGRRGVLKIEDKEVYVVNNSSTVDNNNDDDDVTKYTQHCELQQQQQQQHVNSNTMQDEEESPNSMMMGRMVPKTQNNNTDISSSSLADCSIVPEKTNNMVVDDGFSPIEINFINVVKEASAIPMMTNQPLMKFLTTKHHYSQQKK